MRRIVLVAISCFLLVALTLPGCTAEVDHRFTLTVSSTIGGSVAALGQGTFSYEAGTVVELMAEAEAGYEFVKWTGDVDTVADVNAASTTITMNDDCEILADFEVIPPVQYNLTTSSTAGGSITVPGEGIYPYDEGTVVELVAEAEEGYKFVRWTGDVGVIQDVDAAQATITINGSYSIGASFERKYIPMVAAGVWHTVGLKADGTVVAVGYNEYGQCDVGDWTDIVQVAGGGYHTVGLKSDGTMVAVGGNEYGECNVDGWTDIIQIDAGKHHTVALRVNGTVVATGWNLYGQCNVGGWTDIIQVSAGYYHTVGLRSDGTVVSVGVDADGVHEVGGWTDIMQLDAGAHHTVGLRSDGTVVAVGRNENEECNLDDWIDIARVCAGCRFTLGIKPDGTVVAAGWDDYGQCNVGGWSNIVQVDAGIAHTVGLKYDGSVVATGAYFNGQCNVGDWMLS
jgi:alpha-tubulin suppressor-like RCC1 family protein